MREFNPLDKQNIAKIIRFGLSESKLFPLKSLKTWNFIGNGVYSLYYKGNYILYEQFNLFDCENPIYAGKADPSGTRKGKSNNKNNSLHKRLSDHLSSIEDTDNLNPDDFYFRFLVLDLMWISLAENELITYYRPLWNSVIDGFGNHDPGKGRTNQEMSDWDTIHPGRRWANTTLPDKIRVEEIVNKVDFAKPVLLKIA